jgi:hypothetical protein
MDLFLALAAALAGAALAIVISKATRDLARLREETRLLERELARRRSDRSDTQENGVVPESVTIEVTTPAGSVMLPLRPDDRESIGRFIRAAENARGEPTYATR